MHPLDELLPLLRNLNLTCKNEVVLSMQNPIWKGFNFTLVIIQCHGYERLG